MQSAALSHPVYDVAFVERLLASYAHFLSTPLVPAHVPAERAAAWLYADAPFAVLAHDASADPLFRYANLHAQRCFERSWSELVGIPSRLSAPAHEREDRAALLADVAAHGYSTAYRGLRVAKSGRRFWIEQTELWNVLDADGTRLGQAALFRSTSPA